MKESNLTPVEAFDKLNADWHKVFSDLEEAVRPTFEPFIQFLKRMISKCHKNVIK